jgi:glycerate 2-kinase
MSVIKNSDALATSTAREDALAIAEAGYTAIDIRHVIERKIHLENGHLHIDDRAYPVTNRKVLFVGVGKCAARGGRVIEQLLGSTLTGGIVFDVSATEDPEGSKLETFVGTHPLPSETNVRATERIMEFLSQKRADDLVIMLISGGGSVLLSLPSAPMSFAEEGELFQALTERGAPIWDINIVRKHVSRALGGALAVAAYPAEVVSLIVSDVPGDTLGVVSSGPTVRDPSSSKDARAVLKHYSITPSTKISFLETEKDGKYFKHVTNLLFLSGEDALVSMHEEARRRGYATTIMNAHFSGEAHDIGRAILKELHSSPPKTALLYGGESTVTFDASAGKGGRSQEMALAVMEEIKHDELLLPFASDGQDNTEHAGAIADPISKAHMRQNHMAPSEYLKKHSSYDFFESTGDALITGPTASNVADLVIALKS